MKTCMKKFVAMLCIIATLCSMISLPSMAASSTRKCYLIKNQNTTVYSNTSLTRKYGTVYGSDELTILSVTSKYCKVRYSVTGTSRTKTGYIATSAILTATSGSTYTAKAKIKTYRRPGGASYGYVAKNDNVIILGTYSNYTQIKYPVSGGYKYAFVTTANANSYLKGSGSNSNTSYSTINEGVYKISTALNTSYCLDIHNYGTANGSNLEIYPYHSTKNEHFQIKSAGDGWYYIIDTNSGKALDVAGGSSASQTNVWIYELNYSLAQKWAFISAGSGYYYIKNALGCYLDVQDGVVADAQNVWVYEGNNSSAQRFALTKVSSNNNTNNSTTTSAAVQLNVPSYKQYDSRWKNTYIGSKTIGSIGCLVTSLAMKYSYHTGSTVYPNTMMKSKLTFSNNDLCWSSVTSLGYSYTRSYGCSITNSMMSLIYSKLKAGRPVIIGGQKSSGGTHYVVITGYTGSSTTSFSSGNFKINDPNSSSRTTLAQFLSTYPKVLRIIY